MEFKAQSKIKCISGKTRYTLTIRVISLLTGNNKN